MKKEKNVHVVFLLDRSGSMANCVSDTIGGYNSYLHNQKKNNFKTYVSTILFNEEIKMIHENEDINMVKDITEKDYEVGGCTALYDAIGFTIKALEEKKLTDKKVMFVIMTDGLENASQYFNKSQVSEMITKYKKWEFIFLGAGIDSYKEASFLGIADTNISNYGKNKKSIDNVFASLGQMCCDYCENKDISNDWKKNIETSIDENGNEVEYYVVKD